MSAATQTDFLTRFVEGWAQYLDEECAPDAKIAWRVDGDYAGDEAGIWLASVPTDPARIVVLTPMPMDADPTFTDSRVDLQLRFRAGKDVRSVWALRDVTRRALAGRFPLRLPTGIYVSSLVLAYGTSMGRDASQRWEWADNYRIRASERS